MTDITTAQALNSLWDELDSEIPEAVRGEILISTARQLVADCGLGVKESANV